jgi:hypothetical protein
VQAQRQLDSAEAVAELAAEQGLPVRMVASAPQGGAAAPRTSNGASDQDFTAAPSPAPAPTAPGTQSRVERLTASRGTQARADTPTMPASAASAPPPPAMSQLTAVVNQAPNAAPSAPALVVPAAQFVPDRRPVVAISSAPGEAPAELVGAAPPTPPATSTVVSQREPVVSPAPIAESILSTTAPAQSPSPAVLPAPAARWLDQVGRQAPWAASAMPAAPARTSATMAEHEDAAPAIPAAPATHRPAQTVGQDVAQKPETPASVPGADTTDTPHTDTE